MNKLQYFVVDLFTGKISPETAQNELDLEITLANGDCRKTEKEAKELSEKVKRSAKRHHLVPEIA